MLSLLNSLYYSDLICKRAIGGYADPSQTAPQDQSDQDLHCLLLLQAVIY